MNKLKWTRRYTLMLIVLLLLAAGAACAAWSYCPLTDLLPEGEWTQAQGHRLFWGERKVTPQGLYEVLENRWVWRTPWRDNSFPEYAFLITIGEEEWLIYVSENDFVMIVAPSAEGESGFFRRSGGGPLTPQESLWDDSKPSRICCWSSGVYEVLLDYLKGQTSFDGA